MIIKKFVKKRKLDYYYWFTKLTLKRKSRVCCEKVLQYAKKPHDSIKKINFHFQRQKEFHQTCFDGETFRLWKTNQFMIFSTLSFDAADDRWWNHKGIYPGSIDWKFPLKSIARKPLYKCLINILYRTICVWNEINGNFPVILFFSTFFLVNRLKIIFT